MYLPGIRYAVRQGLDFLDSAIGVDGVWPCRYFSLDEPEIPIDEKNPFTGSLASLQLASMEDERAKTIVARSRDHAIRTMHYPGLWRYWEHLPFDVDTTSTCALAVGAHPWLLAGWNEKILLSNRDDNGPLHTWIQKGRIESLDADAIVNANALAYLGARPETLGIRDWILSLIEDGREEDSIHYYWDKIDLYNALARAARLHPDLLKGARNLLAGRLSECRRPDGTYGDPLRTSLALLALFELDALPPAGQLAGAIEFLLNTQRNEGGWSGSPLSSGPLWPEPRKFVFSSDCHDTACCIAALDRVMRETAGG